MRPVDPNPELFQLQEFMQYQHPRYTSYAVMHPGPFLDIVLPFDGFARFELARFPPETWVDLQDQSGQAIPLAVRVTRGTVTGRWLA